MSFNLKRFRYRRNEHKTEEAALTKDLRGSAISEPDKENKPSPEEQGTMQRQQTAEPDCRVLKTSRQTVEAAEECKASSERCTDDEGRMENGLKLQGVFPGREQKQLQEVIRSTSPLDGAVASCLKRPTEKGPSQKRKLGSLDSSDTQDSDSDMERPRKRKKQDISKVGMSDPGKKEPSLVDQGIMVRKLQWAFPELDKEELLDLLKQHNWNIDEALDELYMSSDLEGPPSSPEAPTRELIRQKPDIPSSCLKAGPRPTTRRALKVQVAPKAKMARQKRRNWRAKKSHSSSSESESGDEFKASSDDDCKNVAQGLKARIVEFLQQASMDELSLIASCSLKKAQKIVEHRPYRSWCDLESVFHTGNSLSFDLVWGCKLVLKERQVVLELMNKCEAISSKMMKDVESLIKKGVGPSKQPTLLNRKLQLKPFQLIGLRWLNLLHQNKLSGILADEMGLGKTIQAISFLASLYQEGIKGPHLIIVPASTLDNWVRELKLWCPSLKVLVYQGPMKDRKDLRQDILSKVVDFNVIVSTYHMTIKNSNDRSLFRKLKLQYAVFDEGHMLKNMETLRYGYLMAINAKYRLLLTGTPLQNNLLELMSLLNFIMPSMFSSSTSEIAKMFSAKSLGEQSSFEKDRISRAKLIMKPFILRRVKSEVMKQLPTKEERVEFCPMSEKQQKLYSTLLEKIKRSASNETKNVLRDMMELRKMANHPLLHRQNYTDEKLATMSQLMLQEPTHHDADPVLIQEDMEVMSDFELHCLCQQYSILESYQLQTDLLLDSGKFALLTELLSSLKQKGDRVVLFSQFTMMLDILEVFLKQLGHSYVRLDGSTPIADRIVQIDKYNSDLEIFVFLLSTRAGGLGISLTTANVVILHDIDCNPYNDKQAEDRCHRVGQTRTVQVFKLVSQDTIEVDILQVSQRKLKLEQDMTAAEDGKEGDLSEDMVSLLKTSLGL